MVCMAWKTFIFHVFFPRPFYLAGGPAFRPSALPGNLRKSPHQAAEILQKSESPSISETPLVNLSMCFMPHVWVRDESREVTRHLVGTPCLSDSDGNSVCERVCLVSGTKKNYSDFDFAFAPTCPKAGPLWGAGSVRPKHQPVEHATASTTPDPAQG